MQKGFVQQTRKTSTCLLSTGSPNQIGRTFIFLVFFLQSTFSPSSRLPWQKEQERESQASVSSHIQYKGLCTAEINSEVWLPDNIWTLEWRLFLPKPPVCKTQNRTFKIPRKQKCVGETSRWQHIYISTTILPPSPDWIYSILLGALYKKEC